MSVRVLPPDLAEKALKELNEDPKRQMDNVQYLKDWISKQPHLHVRTDDQWLVTFLRGCKYSLERTKEKLDLFYSVRTAAPELMRVKHTNPLFYEFLDTGAFLMLPKTAGPDTPRVSIFRPGKYDPEKFNITGAISVADCIEKIMLLEDDHITVAGCVTIFDFEGISVNHLLQVTPALLKKMSIIAQDATPLRIKAVHCLNTPTGFDTLFKTVKSFIYEKNRNKVFVHKNFEELYKHVPKNILPVEYEGSDGSAKEIIECWKNKVKQFHDFLTEEYEYGTVESKRPGKPRTAEDMFGVDGSFRKLEFD